MALTLFDSVEYMSPLSREVPETTWFKRLLVRLHLRQPRRQSLLDLFSDVDLRTAPMGRVRDGAEYLIDRGNGSNATNAS